MGFNIFILILSILFFGWSLLEIFIGMKRVSTGLQDAAGKVSESIRDPTAQKYNPPKQNVKITSVEDYVRAKHEGAEIVKIGGRGASPKRTAKNMTSAQMQDLGNF